MNVFRDGVIAFFSAVGMTTVVWLLAGAVLHAGRPTIPGLLLVLPVRGEALALEHDVRELRRVRARYIALFFRTPKTDIRSSASSPRRGRSSLLWGVSPAWRRGSI